MPNTASTDAHLHQAIPILRVEDIEASLAYYVESLGFKLNWRTPYFLSITRDACSLMLSQGEQGHPGVWMWAAVKNSDELYEELRARGARIRQKPTNFPWGSREIQVTDLDRHVIRFASEATEDEPYGEFMNDEGELHSPVFP